MVSSSCGAKIVDPVVHGVAAGELHAVHLRAHAPLQRGLDVAEQEIRRGAVGFRQLGLEIGEDVEVGAQGGAVVHVGGVDAGPEEGLSAGDALQAVEIDFARGEEIEVFLREIVAHHGDDLDRGEIAGGERNVGGGSAQHAIDFAMRRFHAVIRDGSTTMRDM